MRKSVERRKQAAETSRHTDHTKRRRIVFALILLLMVAGTALAITMMDWRQRQDTQALAAAQKAEFAEIDKRVAATIQKKIDDAKKAEAEAKARAEADAAAAKAKAAANPAGPSTTTTNCDVTNPNSITVVLNKKHCFNPIDWAPSDLISLDGYYMRSEAGGHMQDMMNAASAAGVPFSLSSSYRSYANQQVTYNTWVQTNGSQAAADTVSARPGFSEHQTGLVADLKAGSCALDCFGGTSQYDWLAEHAAEYGFIRRYPDGLTSITGYSPEPWHWRYVGISTAKDMKAKGIQTLEQYLGVSGGDYN